MLGTSRGGENVNDIPTKNIKTKRRNEKRKCKS